MTPLSLLAGRTVCLPEESFSQEMFYFVDKEEPLNIHSLARSKHVHMFCRHCDTALLHAGIQKKKSEIPFLTKEEQVILESCVPMNIGT